MSFRARPALLALVLLTALTTAPAALAAEPALPPAGGNLPSVMDAFLRIHAETKRTWRRDARLLQHAGEALRPGEQQMVSARGWPFAFRPVRFAELQEEERERVLADPRFVEFLRFLRLREDGVAPVAPPPPPAAEPKPAAPAAIGRAETLARLIGMPDPVPPPPVIVSLSARDMLEVTRPVHVLVAAPKPPTAP